MKNVLFIQHSPNIGGAYNALEDIIRFIDKKKFNPIVLLIKNGVAANKLKALNIKTYIKKFGTLNNHAHIKISFSIRSIKHLVAFFMYLPIINIYLRRIIREEHIDLVYLNSFVSIGCGLTPKLMGIPTIIHFREIPVMNFWGHLQCLFAKKISSQIICASRSIKELIRRYFPKAIVIFDSIDIEKFSPELYDVSKTKKDLKIFNKNICVGMLGLLCEAKGIYVFFRSAKLLLKKGFKINFFYIGDFQYSKEKKKIIDLINLSGFKLNFYLMDHIDYQKIAEIINIMDIIVSPNRKPEGFGKTIIEAGSMNKPVIASNLMPINELVVNGQTGIIVKSNKSKNFAKATEYLIGNSAIRRYFGENARKIIVEKFSLRKNLIKIFETIELNAR